MIPISSVRFGAIAAQANTGAAAFSLTGAFPTAGNAPVAGDLLLLFARTVRETTTTSNVSTPQINPATTGFTSKISEVVTRPDATTPSATMLVTHSVRHRIWYSRYTAGMAAPIVDFPLGSTVSDVMYVQLACVTSASAADDPFGEVNTMTAAAAASTTVIGPAPALVGVAPAGSAVFALVGHENQLSSGTIPTLTGNGLTWVEGGEHTGIAMTSAAWATDYALVPADTAITAKSATIATTSGKGFGQMFTILPFVPVSDTLSSQRRRRFRPMVVR